MVHFKREVLLLTRCDHRELKKLSPLHGPQVPLESNLTDIRRPSELYFSSISSSPQGVRGDTDPSLALSHSSMAYRPKPVNSTVETAIVDSTIISENPNPILLVIGRFRG